jgi:hypothetical protein
LKQSEAVQATNLASAGACEIVSALQADAHFLSCCLCRRAPQDQDTKELKVYDLTDYVEEHPGGLSILNNAGMPESAGGGVF